MDQATLVEMQLDNGQRLIDRLREKDTPVRGASWVRESDGGQWYLYLATPLVGDDGAVRPAYRKVNDVVQQLRRQGVGIDPLEIKLVAPTDLIAQAIAAVRFRYPAERPIWLRGQRLGELEIEEAYIYPQ
jgi:hypothetical protein